MPGGLAPLAPTGGPQFAMPNVGGEVAEAIGEYPARQQQLQLQQAELDAQNINNSTKRLSVLTKLISSNQGMATNPQIIGATQRAFKGLGMDAPMKNVNGVPTLDTDALFTFGPASDFIAQNLPLMLQFPADKRADLVQAMTGQALPEGMMQKLSALPQRMVSTPQELSGLYGKATQAIDNLRFPGATVEGALSVIKPINSVLQQNGMPGIDIDDLAGAGLYQSLMNQAQLQGLQGKAAKEYADTNLAKVRAALAPQLADAATTRAAAAQTSASASASRASSYAQRTPAAIAKDYADADKAEADTKKIVQEVATGGASLKDLEANANNGRALVARLESDLNDPTVGLQTQIATYKAAHPEATIQNDPQLKQLNDDAYDVEQRVKQARKAADTAQSAFQQGQARLHSGAPGAGPKHGHAPQGAPTKTLPDGTVIYKGPDGKAYRDDNGQLYQPHE